MLILVEEHRPSLENFDPRSYLNSAEGKSDIRDINRGGNKEGRRKGRWWRWKYRASLLPWLLGMEVFKRKNVFVWKETCLTLLFLFQFILYGHIFSSFGY
jgi:hypothetical protein